MSSSERASTLNIRTMMERLGFAPTEGIAPRFASMFISTFHTCQNCTTAEACGEWLAADTVAALNAAPDFCPNAHALGEIASEPLARWSHHHPIDA